MIVPLGQSPVDSVHVVEQLSMTIELGALVVTDCEIPKELTRIPPLLLTEKND